MFQTLIIIYLLLCSFVSRLVLSSFLSFFFLVLVLLVIVSIDARSLYNWKSKEPRHLKLPRTASQVGNSQEISHCQPRTGLCFTHIIHPLVNLCSRLRLPFLHGSFSRESRLYTRRQTSSRQCNRLISERKGFSRWWCSMIRSERWMWTRGFRTETKLCRG